MAETSRVDLGSVARELGLQDEQVIGVVSLLDEGNTVPFITRYRKERTGHLDEEQIRQIEKRVQALRQIAERADTILRLIEAQGKLTPSLRRRIQEADSLKRLEDLYAPFRPKRRSRAQAARERGLGPLAEQIWTQDPAIESLDGAAEKYVDPAKDLPSAAEVLQGVGDILAERISDDADARDVLRRIAWRTGRLSVSASETAETSGQEYRNYFDFEEGVAKIPPHRLLALNRGEKAGALRVRFAWDAGEAHSVAMEHLGIAGHRHAAFLEGCVRDALARLIHPSLDREIRRELTERAEAHAVQVFATNLRNLLLQPPLRGRRVLAIDPGYRTGCKIAVLDELGRCLLTDVIYVAGSAEKKAAAREKLIALLRENDCSLVAIGNGTACRDTEEIVAGLISDGGLEDVRYVIVNEGGASVYSTSTVAREEFPEFDATLRGTISIGRRLQDPLSELVKIDPQHIGVGLYQHDLSPRALGESLEQVIESCVNYVGVDLNTASASLLRHVSGLNQLIARRIVAWRDEHGRFSTRRQLLEVPGIGEATFTQAAGFLKIAGGDEPLDGTWIHPESYDVARQVLGRLETSPNDLSAGDPLAHRDRLAQLDRAALARELNVGTPTLQDILEALARPGRDPRTELPGPVFKQGILKLSDLAEGMELQGTVLNVVDFGAFVDVGLKESGLVHISELSVNYVATPHEVVAVGDVITVWVLGIDAERKRVSLTMIPPGTPRKQGRARQPEQAPREKPQPPKSAEPPKQQQQPPKPQQQRPKSQKKRTDRPHPPLTASKREGDEPLRGFDELRALWRERGQ